MKRNVLFFIWICLALSLQAARAQGTQEWQEGKRPVYCNVMGYNFWGVGKVKVRLDMGDGRFSSLYDEQGKALKFGTMMSVLDYMGVRVLHQRRQELSRDTLPSGEVGIDGRGEAVGSAAAESR